MNRTIKNESRRFREFRLLMKRLHRRSFASRSILRDPDGVVPKDNISTPWPPCLRGFFLTTKTRGTRSLIAPELGQKDPREDQGSTSPFSSGRGMTQNQIS